MITIQPFAFPMSSGMLIKAEIRFNDETPNRDDLVRFVYAHLLDRDYREVYRTGSGITVELDVVDTPEELRRLRRYVLEDLYNIVKGLVKQYFKLVNTVKSFSNGTMKSIPLVELKLYEAGADEVVIQYNNYWIDLTEVTDYIRQLKEQNPAHYIRVMIKENELVVENLTTQLTEHFSVKGGAENEQNNA